MRRALLRPALLIVGIALIGTAVALGLAGCGLGAALRLGLPGLVLAAALLIERWRYRPPAAHGLGPGWTATGERFIDPETGRLVEVWWRSETGERRYQPGPASGPRSSAG
ncbi:MAG TPA: hypothetical protein VFQ82_03000 [Stellaceae bacterium]|nr:hypothetical protein [Stellaceae bacterium]